VIIVGPELRLNQCGLSKEMALEMFKPFVLRQIIINGLAPNVRSAKNVLDSKIPEVFDILEEITRNHPVLLNRAPTLHKLGIQAFYPVLIEGKAIRVHPCVCDAYNADFDGDQMAVHIPLSAKARQEAEEYMLPIHNLLRPSDGSPITVPAKKEMALGIYYLTSIDTEAKVLQTIFSDFDELMYAYQIKAVQTRQLVKVKFEGRIMETTPGRIMFNKVLPENLQFVNESITQPHIKKLFTQALKTCSQQQIADMIDNIKDLGFTAGTISGLSVSITDCLVYHDKNKIIEKANSQVSEHEENYKLGLITDQERKRLTLEVWIDTTEELADKTWETFTDDNPVKLIIDARVGRTTREQIKQLSAMKGLVVDPLGNIVDMPTKSNYREGLTIFEYVTTARGGRKGLTDTAIKTADAGYLTRRLVDVAHDAILRMNDCGTTEGLVISRGNRDKSYSKRLMGRVLAEDVVDLKTKKVLYVKGSLLDEEDADLIDKSGTDNVVVRSPIACHAPVGVCVNCYGWDLAEKKLPELGYPAGIIAAQSIGEPGTQLTMRTKHSAGVIGLDVTQGLPRVEELLEARTPKSLMPLADISGKVKVEETDNEIVVTVKSVGIKPESEKSFYLPLSSKLLVKTNDLIAVGTQLAAGPLDLKEVLKTRGLRGVQNYLVEMIQEVYESQGIPINDKHFEIVVRKMSEKVRISSPGDTSFLIGQITSRMRFEEENRKIIAEGGDPAAAQVIILGITRSSLHTESWLSAASFIQTTNVLSSAAASGSVDDLMGMKENVIIGRLIPTSPERAALELEA
jgi:DNA-directed RNA polymerase subunit beta'